MLSPLEKYFQSINHLKGSAASYDLSLLLRGIPILEALTVVMPYQFSVMDYSTQKFIYVSPDANTILGYDNKMLLDEGPKFIFDILHPLDAHAAAELTADSRMVVAQRPVNERLGIRLNYLLRYYHANGELRTLKHDLIFIHIDQAGNPILGLYILNDITDLVPVSFLRYEVPFYYINPKTRLYQKFAHRIFNPITNEIEDGWSGNALSQNPFTHREQEVFACLVKGMSNKDVADSLNISVHTINMHRRNILAKTNSHSLAGALHTALTKGWC